LGTTLRPYQTQEIIELFEQKLTTLKHISRAEKMKLRKRINNVLRPLLILDGQTPDSIVAAVESKLRDIISMFVDEQQFLSKLKRVLSEKFNYD
jgi:hypothetical protein